MENSDAELQAPQYVRCQRSQSRNHPPPHSLAAPRPYYGMPDLRLSFNKEVRLHD